MYKKYQKAERLSAMRTEKGMSQSQLAKAANLNVRTLQFYEQGVRDFSHARMSTILAVCNALNCDVSDILEDGDAKDTLDVYKQRTCNNTDIG